MSGKMGAIRGGTIAAMMQKIINTMFYGSLKAKVFLWSVFIMILATILMGVLAAVMGSATFLVGAVVCGVAAFITSQSVSLSELERKAKNPKKKKKKDSATASKRESSAREKKEETLDGQSNDPKEKNKQKARYMASMNEKKMKQLLKEHKVNQIHIFVMVDSYPREDVSQTPAVMWRTDTDLHLLMLDGTGREFKVAMEEIKGILYQKNVPASPEEDYPSFQYANFMSKLYKPFLPEYQEMSQDGEIQYVKNLFTIEPGISFTNTSMAGVLKILNHVPLLVKDSINMSSRYDEYFKEIYRYSILCKNGIYTLEEYRGKMEKVLDELLTAPVTRQEFVKSLRDMGRYHLITSDYVTKYTQIYITRNQS